SPRLRSRTPLGSIGRDLGGPDASGSGQRYRGRDGEHCPTGGGSGPLPSAVLSRSRPFALSILSGDPRSRNRHGAAERRPLAYAWGAVPGASWDYGLTRMTLRLREASRGLSSPGRLRVRRTVVPSAPRISLTTSSIVLPWTDLPS